MREGVVIREGPVRVDRVAQDCALVADRLADRVQRFSVAVRDQDRRVERLGDVVEL